MVHKKQLDCSCFDFSALLYFLGPGFGSDAANPHLPHNHEPNQVVYTGTHDNDTVLVLPLHLLSLGLFLVFSSLMEINLKSYMTRCIYGNHYGIST